MDRAELEKKINAIRFRQQELPTEIAELKEGLEDVMISGSGFKEALAEIGSLEAELEVIPAALKKLNDELRVIKNAEQTELTEKAIKNLFEASERVKPFAERIADEIDNLAEYIDGLPEAAKAFSVIHVTPNEIISIKKLAEIIRTYVPGAAMQGEAALKMQLNYRIDYGQKDPSKEGHISNLQGFSFRT